MKALALIAICSLASTTVLAQADRGYYFEQMVQPTLIKSHKGANSIQIRGDDHQQCINNLSTTRENLAKKGKVVVQIVECDSTSKDRGTIHFF